jgi:4-hydroxy-2-oxoglutarate aldolase
MYREKLCGVFPPLTTPFVDEAISCEKMAENIGRYNETGLAGYMPLGSNGEFRSLTDEEALQIAAVVRRTMSPGKTLIAGAARESVQATVEFIKKLADCGVDFATLLPPSYFVSAMTDEALIRYYTMVAERSPIPIMFYNAPKFTAGVSISARVIAALSPHPNIAGIKDTSNDDVARYVEAASGAEDFAVLAGTINKFYDGLVKGAVGGVLSIADYLPGKCVAIYEAFIGGDQPAASRLEAEARALSKNAAGQHGVSGVKAAMDLLGYFGGDPRAPLAPLTPQQKQELRAVLHREGLL